MQSVINNLRSLFLCGETLPVKLQMKLRPLSIRYSYLFFSFTLTP